MNAAKVREARINSVAMVLVGRVLTADDFAESRLYASDFTHRFRRGTKPGGEGGSGAEALPATSGNA